MMAAVAASLTPGANGLTTEGNLSGTYTFKDTAIIIAAFLLGIMFGMLFENRDYFLFEYRQCIRRIRRRFRSPVEEPEIEELLVDAAQAVDQPVVDQPLPAMGSNDIPHAVMEGLRHRRHVDQRPPAVEPEAVEARDPTPIWIARAANRIDAADAYIQGQHQDHEQTPYITVGGVNFRYRDNIPTRHFADGERFMVGPGLRARARRIIYLVLAAHPMANLDHNPARKIHVYENCNGRSQSNLEFTTRNICTFCLDRVSDFLADRLFYLLHIDMTQDIALIDVTDAGAAFDFINRDLFDRGMHVGMND